jgi:hypothetical protein
MDGEIRLFMGVKMKGIGILGFLTQSIKKAMNLGHFLRCRDLAKIIISIRGMVFFLLELHKSKEIILASREFLLDSMIDRVIEVM